jgi:hypothetical protein
MLSITLTQYILKTINKKNMVDYYKHLNEDDKVKFSIPETAKTVFELNYGQQRFLCEILKLREASENMKFVAFRRQTKELRDLLESGWY